MGQNCICLQLPVPDTSPELLQITFTCLCSHLCRNCVLHMCACVGGCVWECTCFIVLVWRSQYIFVESILSLTFMRVLGIKLKSPGLHHKCHITTEPSCLVLSMRSLANTTVSYIQMDTRKPPASLEDISWGLLGTSVSVQRHQAPKGQGSASPEPPEETDLVVNTDWEAFGLDDNSSFYSVTFILAQNRDFSCLGRDHRPLGLMLNVRANPEENLPASLLVKLSRLFGMNWKNQNNPGVLVDGE